MRVVTRQELMSLPNGTIYHECEPCVFRDMTVKRDTIQAGGADRFDWWETSIPVLVQEPQANQPEAFVAMWDGGSKAVDLETAGREALFDDKLRYAVWEHADLVALAGVVQRALDVAKPVA